jgi:putative solute:sodium symporter small subunit|tara:strand:- start:92 stop:448 length:357 start_codon:yes stop_codon:yes gene_type:complete
MNALQKENAQAYWKENIRLMLSLLAVWFVVSFGMGILFADELNNIRFFGFKLGFWMAQQGAIYVFVVLIFVYVAKMNKMDRKYGVDEGDDVYVEDEEYYHHEESFIESISEVDDKKGA